MLKNMIGDKTHCNIFRRVYLYSVIRILCAKLGRENRRLRKELEKLRSTLLQKKEGS